MHSKLIRHITNHVQLNLLDDLMSQVKKSLVNANQDNKNRSVEPKWGGEGSREASKKEMLPHQ